LWGESVVRRRSRPVVEFLYPRGLPEDSASTSRMKSTPFCGGNGSTSLGWPAHEVMGLANAINEGILRQGAYPRDEIERLAKVLPGGVAAPEVELAALRDRVRELEQRLGTQTRVSPRRPPGPPKKRRAAEPPKTGEEAGMWASGGRIRSHGDRRQRPRAVPGRA
jgi:hypothetical protein